MAQYISDGGKKKEHLARSEWKLICALEHGEIEKKITAAAEGVRQAKIREVKARQARLSPSATYTPEALVAQLNKEINDWADMAVEEIIATYRSLPTRRKAEIEREAYGRSRRN